MVRVGAAEEPAAAKATYPLLSGVLALHLFLSFLLARAKPGGRLTAIPQPALANYSGNSVSQHHASHAAGAAGIDIDRGSAAWSASRISRAAGCAPGTGPGCPPTSIICFLAAGLGGALNYFFDLLFAYHN